MSGRVLARRILVAIVTLFAVVVFNFFLFRTLGDPAKDLIRGRLPASVRQAIIHERGYDQSTPTQFWRYLKGLAHFDLGTSNTSERPVTDELGNAIPNTLLLLGLSTVLSMIIGTRLGVIAAWRRGKWRDTAIGQTSLALYSMPDFWLGMIFVGRLRRRSRLAPGRAQADAGRRELRLRVLARHRHAPDPSDAHADARRDRPVRLHHPCRRRRRDGIGSRA